MKSLYVLLVASSLSIPAFATNLNCEVSVRGFKGVQLKKAAFTPEQGLLDESRVVKTFKASQTISTLTVSGRIDILGNGVYEARISSEDLGQPASSSRSTGSLAEVEYQLSSGESKVIASDLLGEIRCEKAQSRKATKKPSKSSKKVKPAKKEFVAPKAPISI